MMTGVKSASISDHEDKETEDVEVTGSVIEYGVTDTPPVIVTTVCAVQCCTQIVSLCLTSAVLISEAICGSAHVTAKLMSTSMFLAGFTTLCQATIGVRLPVFQGPTLHYVVPVLARAELSDWVCLTDTNSSLLTPGPLLQSGNSTLADSDWQYKLAEISGVLMVVSVIHAVIGASGLGGQLTRVIGPLTVAPAVTVMILKMVDNLMKFTFIQLGVSAFTLCLTVFCSGYLSNILVPMPSWSRKKGFYITRSRFIRTYAVMISLSCGWFLSYILTVTEVFTSDPDSLEFKARTDNAMETLEKANWFYFPYPGQFGPPRFSVPLLFGLLVAMLSSVIDSLADYNIVSRLCGIPKPPAHATNRGLLTEGFCSILSGLFGVGHATSTYVAVTGSLAITGVMSLNVFQVAGVMMMLLGVVGKVGAFLVLIPKPVIGAVMIVVFSSVIGTLLAGLNEVDMKRPRNCLTVGLPIMLGTMIPKMVASNQYLINTGNTDVNHAVRAMCGTPLFVAGVLACILDNTLPGGRGEVNVDIIPKDVNSESHSVYRLPVIHNYLLHTTWSRYFPFLPGFKGYKHISKE